MAQVPSKKKTKKGLLLGVGLDSDGHKRVTTGKNFAMLGGTQETHDEMVEKVFKSKTLTGELNTVEQVAAVAVLRASDAGRGITGSFINVDGGQAPY